MPLPKVDFNDQVAQHRKPCVTQWQKREARRTCLVLFVAKRLPCLLHCPHFWHEFLPRHFLPDEDNHQHYDDDNYPKNYESNANNDNNDNDDNDIENN